MGEFAIRLKKLRMDEHLTQDELAPKLGISRSTLGMYETGKREPDFETLETIADFFNVNMSYLTGYSDDPRDWERIANDLGIAPPSDYDGDPEDWFKMKMLDNEDSDSDLSIIQRERSKMSPKEKTKLMNILKANFDDYNWEEDDSGDIE